MPGNTGKGCVEVARGAGFDTGLAGSAARGVSRRTTRVCGRAPEGSNLVAELRFGDEEWHRCSRGQPPTVHIHSGSIEGSTGCAEVEGLREIAARGQHFYKRFGGEEWGADRRGHPTITGTTYERKGLFK